MYHSISSSNDFGDRAITLLNLKEPILYLSVSLEQDKYMTWPQQSHPRVRQASLSAWQPPLWGHCWLLPTNELLLYKAPLHSVPDCVHLFFLSRLRPSNPYGCNQTTHMVQLFCRCLLDYSIPFYHLELTGCTSARDIYAIRLAHHVHSFLKHCYQYLFYTIVDQPD